MKCEMPHDQFGVHALARYKAVLVEIDETIRQTKHTIERSQELIRRLDQVIGGGPQQRGDAVVAAVEPPREIIVIIPRDWAQFHRLVTGAPIDAESVRPAIASRPPSGSH
jgi:hypothetical protein